jgi:hypothetical protein
MNVGIVELVDGVDKVRNTAESCTRPEFRVGHGSAARRHDDWRAKPQRFDTFSGNDRTRSKIDGHLGVSDEAP